MYLNEKNMDLEVGIDGYDVPLEPMCTMCQPRKKQVPGWDPIVYLNEKNMDLEVGIDVYDVPAPKKKQVPGWNPIVYLNEKNMDLEWKWHVLGARTGWSPVRTPAR